MTSLIASLSELAAAVQRGRTIDSVLEIAGNGALRIGVRLVAFQFAGNDLVLRYGEPIRGLADGDLIRGIIEGRRAIYREDLAAPETAGITNGVVAPLFVRQQPWGVLSLVSRTFVRDDADAVALFATHLASSIEIAENMEALARAQEELVARERLAALGELAAVVAHEIRNPLGALFNSLGSLRRLLAEGERDEGEAELLLSIANEEATRLNGIVSDLLDFARPGVPSLQPAALAEVIEDAARASDAVIDLDVQPDLPNVLMDPRLMRQALVNLLLNGIQSMPDQDPTMRVCARREGDSTVRIDVTDHGAGISASDRDRIFEPFFTTKASGTGLGLAVVKRIVDSHLGTIEVSSAPTGTTFTLRFPVATADLGR